MKKLITEQTIVDASRRGEKKLAFESSTIITAAARDKARFLGIQLVERGHDQAPTPATPPTGLVKTGTGELIVIGSDHGGFGLKEQLKPHIASLGYRVTDVGTYSEEACDYPDFAYAVARTVNIGEASKGIMIDAIGLASAIVANKLPGIRATCCFDEFSARSAREHNDANVLTLGGRTLGTELAKSIVAVWLGTSFGGGRHQKRLDKITEIEHRPKS